MVGLYSGWWIDNGFGCVIEYGFYGEEGKRNVKWIRVFDRIGFYLSFK